MVEEAGGIRVRQLTKVYGRFRALNRVDLDIAPGEYVTILGPNGAGKSTLLGVISGLIRPDRGEIWVDGRNVVKSRDEAVYRAIGALSYQTYLYEDLTARENLRFYGRLYDVERLGDTLDRLLEQVGMTTRADSPVKTLSRGMRQRVALARALLHNPSILLLDEPYIGLDQEAMDMFHRFLTAGRRAVLLVTHDMRRGLEVADRLVIMASGRIVLDRKKETLTLETLERLYREHTT